MSSYIICITEWAQSIQSHFTLRWDRRARPNQKQEILWTQSTWRGKTNAKETIGKKYMTVKKELAKYIAKTVKALAVRKGKALCELRWSGRPFWKTWVQHCRTRRIWWTGKKTFQGREILWAKVHNEEMKVEFGRQRRGLPNSARFWWTKHSWLLPSWSIHGSGEWGGTINNKITKWWFEVVIGAKKTTEWYGWG